MLCQKHQFDLPDAVHYLNASTMGASLKAAVEAGQQALLRKTQLHRLTAADFFTEAARTRQLFGQLIQADADRIAIMPSVSYGMTTVAKNLACKPGLQAGQEIVLLHEDFPSDVYAWEEVCAQKELVIKTIAPPAGSAATPTGRGQQWNEQLLAAISDRTVLVAVPHVHWTDGTYFDLVALRQRTREVGAWLIVDGSQSVGVMPFDVQLIQPDALVAGAYKYMLGPYGVTLAYFSEIFDDGVPIEAAWINRVGSEDFSRLATYQREYQPKAARYNMGEHGNFILLPMLNAALTKLLEWGVDNLYAYCGQLTHRVVPALRELGYWTEDIHWRSNHLMGIRLPVELAMENVKQALADRNISVSVRGTSIRVSTHIWNDEPDLTALLEVLETVRGRA